MQEDCGISSPWKRVRAWWLTHEWQVVGFLALAAAGLGCVGFARYFMARGESWSLLEVVYRSLQMFVLNFDAPSMLIPGELQLARLLAPAVAAYAAIKTLGVIFREQLELRRMRRLRRHVVICGMGRTGPQLVRDFRRHGDQVVAVEMDKENDEIATCRDVGAIPLVGNATDIALLRKAGVHRASHLIAVCGHDGTNVEIAMRAQQLAHAHSHAAKGNLQCHIHIVDLPLCNLFRQHRIFSDAGDAFHVRAFNIYQDSARLLFNKYPLDHVPLSATDPRVVHVVIIGFGQMGESVLLQAAKIGHYANGKRLRVTVIDRNARRQERLFRYRQPQFDQICDSEFLEGDIEEPATVEDVVRLATEPGCVPTVVACLPDDTGNLSCALSALPRLEEREVPILIRTMQERGWSSLLEVDRRASSLAAHVHPFGMINATCTRAALLNEDLHLFARAIHQKFVQEREQEGRPATDPSMQPWNRLDETFRESNRQQADHVAVKLRAIGCYSALPETGKTPVGEFSPEEVEVLARMEHARWNAERFLDGWTLVRDNPDKTKKQSPWLVSWDELPDTIKGYDRDAVLRIPLLLGLVGQKVYR